MDKHNPQSSVHARSSSRVPASDVGIDLRELLKLIWCSRWLISGLVALFSIGSVLFALSVPNTYEAEAVLAPSEEAQGGGLSKMAGQLGGLASLAGISLSTGDGINKVAVALEVMKSRRFINDFIQRHKLLPEVMAVERWVSGSNTLVFDEDLYDFESGEWVREVDPPKTPRPSAWEAYKVFMDMLTVVQDLETGFVTVAIEHQSPYVAGNWVKLLVEDINAAMREQDVAEARRSVQYLNEQLETVALAEMRTVFYQLIEDQIQTMMLAEVRDEYIFTTIDPPVVPEDKVAPSRALICILGAILGGLAGVTFVLVRYLITRD